MAEIVSRTLPRRRTRRIPIALERDPRYRRLFQASPDAVLLMTTDGCLLDANPAACQLFGWTRGTVRRMRCEDLIDPSDPRLAVLLDERARRGAVQGEVTALHKEGRRFPAAISSTVFIDADKVEKALTIVRDLSTPQQTGDIPAHNALHLEDAAEQPVSRVGTSQDIIEQKTLVQEHTQALQQTNTVLQQEITQQQHVEQQLRTRLAEIETLEERLRLAFAVAHMSYWDRNLLTGETIRSVGAEAMMGLTPGELGPTSDRFFAMIHPEERARVQTGIARTLQEGEAYEEYRVIWPDSTMHWLATHARTFRGSNGQPIRMMGVNLDITRRKHAEDALRQSEERFRIALAHSPITVFHHDTKLRYTWVYNPTPGLRVEDILGKRDDEVLPPQEAAQLMAVKQQALASRQRVHQEVSYVVEGNRRSFDLTVEPLWDATGRLAGLTGAATDVTARRQAADALRAADVRLRSHIEHSPLAVIEWDRELRVAQWSPRAEQLLGWSAKEVLGKRRQEWPLVVEEDDAHVQEAIAPFLKAAEPHTSDQWEVHENRNYTKDRRILYCEWYNSFLYDEAGRFTSILSLVHDVTVRKQVEEALARALTDLRGIAYIAAHDLQEPVRQVGLYTQKLVARFRGAVETDIQEAAGFLVEGAQRMLAQLNALMQYLEVDATDIERTVTDCETVLQRALAYVRPALTISGATVTHAPLPTLRAQPAHLQLVFQELLDNALKFRTPAPPQVHIWAEREERGWRFAVRDNGLGIAPQSIGQLFRFFRRLQRRSAYPGTGMGLALCKKVVERHGGRIWIDSQIGNGTTVYFTISDSERG